MRELRRVNVLVASVVGARNAGRPRCHFMLSTGLFVLFAISSVTSGITGFLARSDRSRSFRRVWMKRTSVVCAVLAISALAAYRGTAR